MILKAKQTLISIIEFDLSCDMTKQNADKTNIINIKLSDFKVMSRNV